MRDERERQHADSRLSGHYLHLETNTFKVYLYRTQQIRTSNPSSSNNFFQINGELSLSLRLPTLAKAVMHPCFPQLFREHFLVRSDSQQHWPRAQNEEHELSCLTKPIPTPALSQTDVSPVVGIGPGAVEQCHKWSSSPTDGVQGQRNPIYRGEHEEGECKDECLVVLLPYTAVNPPKGKKRLLKEKRNRFFFPLPSPSCQRTSFPRCFYTTQAKNFETHSEKLYSFL